MGEKKLTATYTPEEAAQLLKVDIQRIWRLSREGALKKVPNMGKTVRFTEEALLDFLHGTSKRK